MPKPSKGKNEVNILEKMSTGELENILKMDASNFTDESDTDYIFKVLEVIEKREKENPSGKYNIDVESSWKVFQDEYNTSTTSNNCEAICKVDKKKAVKSHGQLYKVASIVAIFIITFIGSVSVASSIFNKNIWGAIAEWGKEQFGFTANFSEMQEEIELNNKLKENGIDYIKVPKKIPASYKFTGIESLQTPKKKRFVARYVFEHKELILSVNYMGNINASTYEKNEDVEIYTKDDITYYVINNYDKIQVVWLYDNYECCIQGDISETELKAIINSI